MMTTEITETKEDITTKTMVEEITETDIKETTEMKTITGGNKEDNIMGITTIEIIMIVMNIAEEANEDLITSKEESNETIIDVEMRKATEEEKTIWIILKGNKEATEEDNLVIINVVAVTRDIMAIEEEEDNSEVGLIEAIINVSNMTEMNKNLGINKDHTTRMMST